jgi:XTP/dITP diphosphohydrolase
METLRAECGWKREQTHRSLARYLVEETWEVLEAIEVGDLEHLREELGDLLLQIYFHAIIAAEEGAFTIDDVARDIIAKMKRRNPHVFPPPGQEKTAAGDAASINEMWESIKAAEKSRTSVTDGIPPGLPALLYADKVLDRLARESSREVPPVVTGGSASCQSASADDLGERLLVLVAEARQSGVDPEQALRDAVRRLLSPEI